MPYNDNNYKDHNVNYLNKDFSSLKNRLIQYAKQYFSNSYRDFNETSPGMMMIEMSAYVGDVLSFYIDQQYREMLLPLAEERRNIVNIAKGFGYKVKPIMPAYTELTFTQEVDALSITLNNRTPDFRQALVLQKGLKVQSTSDDTMFFETISPVDFTVSGSGMGSSPPVQIATDSNGLVTKYKLTRKVKAISGQTRTTTFSVNQPQQFKRLSLSEKNVIEVISCIDSNGNNWYEVDYLAQDRVPIKKHYTEDWVDGQYYSGVTTARIDAYHDENGNLLSTAVPYSLEYIHTPKRFMVEVDEHNTTSLVFGNGFLRTGTTGSLSTYFEQTSQAGQTIPGEIQQLNAPLDPQIGTSFSTLGEIPQNTVLTVTYRVGGGQNANVPVGDLNTVNSFTVLNNADYSTAGVTVRNNVPGRGGSEQESIEEIRHKSMAHFKSQARCVTKEDYEARVMSMPSIYGGVKKVYVDRIGLQQTLAYTTQDAIGSFITTLLNNLNSGTLTQEEVNLQLESLGISIEQVVNYLSLLANPGEASEGMIATIDCYTLGSNNDNNLITLNDMIKLNLKNHLSEFRMITDEVSIKDGKVINFGVIFDITGTPTSNKNKLKFQCIEVIKKYFHVDKMQFKQPLHISQIEFELMKIDGVKSVNNLYLTQSDPKLKYDLFDYFYDPNTGTMLQSDFLQDNNHAGIYNWKYDFEGNLYNGTILPSVEPSIFELKNPNSNIVGIVN